MVVHDVFAEAARKQAKAGGFLISGFSSIRSRLRGSGGQARTSARRVAEALQGFVVAQ